MIAPFPMDTLLFVLAAQVVLSVLIVTQDLMEELRTTENKVAFARQHFSDAVTAYSVERESFPTVFLAEAFKYKEAELFEVELEEEREAVEVAFS